MANAPEAPEGKKKSGFLKYIILVVLLLVLGGGGYFAYLKFFAAKPAATDAAAPAEGQPAPEAQKAEDGHAAKPEEKKAEGGHGEAKGGEAKGGHGGKDKAPSNNVALPPFVVNLADPNARRYLKIVLDVEMTGNPELLEANQAKIRDSLLMLLSSKTSQDLATLEGKILLRKEIVDRLNQALGQAKVARVYFTDFVIQ
ncbi:flagellar basal body-associated protein FliL [Solidesulfovibrio carbinoliphilus subsp. oakridgensis]|uniref:Flagellar protein FliL n=1 Tax=Solidesulfovibrio carbinoliphilus subsp. oakridgensis TaxID=694327 RepID=G7Q593_9BACT|nr:flagellar basal body-associated FliL family protein [Solidesulfovibrio carbinoliphilus]EHJ48416.1 flagellar basal body-associated protein FliL [Solidesulfovibrio carbinoliphilus subsp. oakridgensis]